ncbi:Chromosome transmission fidelity protein 18 [Savitreella phatthalungensis]
MPPLDLFPDARFEGFPQTANPFELDDAEQDPSYFASSAISTSATHRGPSVPDISVRKLQEIGSLYAGTANAKTSDGKIIRIAKRRRVVGKTAFQVERDTEHLSRNRYYGVPVHALLSELEGEQREAEALRQSEQASLRAETFEYEPIEELWVDKYRPKKFTDLLGDERTSRDVMRWIRQWDYCVFGKRSSAAARKTGKENDDTRANDKPKDLFERPERKILMLTGPPGLGKTTLAHVAARQAGYDVIEVNASDDRTGAVVQHRIGSALESQAVFNPRPTMVIIDEVDGVGGGGGEAGFIRTLLRFIQDDEKASQDAMRSLSNAGAFTKSKRKRRSVKSLLRPIICICNDQYVSALRPLRQHCQIIQVRPLHPTLVVTRLRDICKRESLPADARALNTLCELADSDLRSCLNSLQYIKAKRGAHLSIESVNASLNQRDMSRSSHSVIEQVFSLPNAKAERKKGRTNVADQKRRSDKIAELALTNGEYSKLLAACHAHYPRQPYHDSLLVKPIKAADWLFFADQCDRHVYDHQHGEMLSYMPYPVAAFNSLFASADCRKVERSKVDWEVRERTRVSSEILEGWRGGVHPDLRQLYPSTTGLATELLPLGLKCIALDLNPTGSTLIRASDKHKLSRTVDGMIKLGLGYVQHRADDHGNSRAEHMGSATANGRPPQLVHSSSSSGSTGYIYKLEPPITELLDYNKPTADDSVARHPFGHPSFTANVVTPPASSSRGDRLLPQRYVVRQMVVSGLQNELIRRRQEHTGEGGVDKRPADDVSANQQPPTKRIATESTARPNESTPAAAATAVMAVPVAVKKDFFGRVIAVKPPVRTASPGGMSEGGTSRAHTPDTLRKSGSGVSTKPKATVFVRFSDGFSDAVRTQVSIHRLLQGCPLEGDTL